MLARMVSCSSFRAWIYPTVLVWMVAILLWRLFIGFNTLCPRLLQQHATSPTRVHRPDSFEQLWSPLSNLTPPISRREHHVIQHCVQLFPHLGNYSFDPLIPSMNKARLEAQTFLNANSMVVEVGGYTGKDALNISRLFHPNYHVLEPMPNFFSKLHARFRRNHKFKLYPFGLGRHDQKLSVQSTKDSTTTFGRNGSGNSTIVIKEAKRFFTGLGLPRKSLDLLQLNCEGCEYELLEVLLESGLISAVRHLVVQFHFGLAGLERLRHRYCALQTLLLRSHQPRWQFRFTWQQWELAV